MSKINDGGPAFPQNDATVNRINNHDGMSIRDWFAGQAMQAFIISEVIEAFRRNDYDGRQAHATYLPINNTIDMAEAAYIQADAMMLARWPKEPLT